MTSPLVEATQVWATVISYVVMLMALSTVVYASCRYITGSLHLDRLCKHALVPQWDRRRDLPRLSGFVNEADIAVIAAVDHS